MSKGYVSVRDRHFDLDGEKIVLRGHGLGSWLNLEHFMIGLPGTDSQIRTAITDAYGKERAEQFWKAYYRSLVGEKDFEFLKGLGVNAIRVPFNYRLFENDQEPYVYDEEGFREIDRILQLCEHYQIHAVLDLHAAPGGQNPDWHSDNALGESLFWEYADFRKRTVALWKYIAERYAANRWVAAYDLLNEPMMLIKDVKLIERFYTELIDGIRSVDRHHLLFVEGDIYATRFEMFEPFDDPNTALSFHFYPFMHQHKSSKKTQRERIRDAFAGQVSLDDLLTRLGRPVWCGETGATYSADNRAEQVSMLRDTLEFYEENGVSWSVWTYKDACAMGTVHPKENSAWMRFSESAKRQWNFWEDFATKGASVDMILEKYPANLPWRERMKIGFRIMADYQLVLKERYPKLFENIPFDALLEAVDSFNFENCEIWREVADLVKQFQK